MNPGDTLAIHPGFGVALTRLMNHRRTDVARLSSASGVPEAELRAVVSGTSPSAGPLSWTWSGSRWHCRRTGEPFELVEPPWPDDPLPAEMAGLLWSCRRLTPVQVGLVRDEAESMLVPVPDDASAEEWNRVRHHHGRWWGASRQ
ncbi:hypothetical protein ACIGDI_32980 [Streptomyces sp. NPDC085900]|uniref:hypothetical protein n=1 Tax=Streptomyces sp. NPDC085900 TaxID=3365737 RepID=UPI0037D858DE